MRLGGLDIGTTGCKLSVYGKSGELLCNAYREYDVSRVGGAHEVDASVILSAVKSVIADCARQHAPNAIGVTSFGESFVLLDETDGVLLPSMLYTDPRGSVECDRLCASLGEDFLIQTAGVKPHPMYSLPKLMWIHENLPEVYARARRVLLMEDYIVYMLSGTAQIDYSLAARTMAFDIRKKCWNLEILNAAGIDPSLLSTPVPTGTVAGCVRPSIAEELGLSPETVIVSGAHDQVASAVGAGVFGVGEAVDGTGTVECITPVFDAIPTDPTLYAEGYSVVPYVFENTYVCYALSFTGGATLKWFRDNFAAKYGGEENVYAALDRNVPADPTGILILPHFAGAANPYMDNASRAAIVGLTLEHTAEDLYKALMEGVTYEIMTNLEHLSSFGITPSSLFATGGGARSEVWLQIKADILGKPITSLLAKEVGAVGTCMLVGRAIGLYRDLDEAKARFVHTGKTYCPNPDRYAKYQAIYAAYRKLYGAVRPIVEDLK